MIVYGNSISPFVRKVLAFAHEKGIAITLEAAGLGGGSPEFYEASPFKKMPAFRDPGADDGRDFTISDSTAIIAYLDTKFPEPNLIPASAVDRARVIWFEEFADTIVVGAFGKIFFNRFVAPKFMKREGDLAAADAAEANEVPPILDYLEAHIPESGFLVGDRLTLADIAVASPFVNLMHCGSAVDAARWPKTAAYVAAILARPSFAAMVAAESAVVAAMA
ncbi:MAG: glutathione S-transferase [Sphingomonas sp.]|nr:glutathione S-transferase [Sphingomonas sp.]